MANARLKWEDAAALLAGCSLVLYGTQLVFKPKTQIISSSNNFIGTSLFILGNLMIAYPFLQRSLKSGESDPVISRATSDEKMTSGLPDSIKQKLLLTKSQYRQKHVSASGVPFDKIVIGAAIFHPHDSTKICLLKRTPDEVYYPNVFELPSGNVDPTDASLMHAIIREVKEETGFEITNIVAELEPFFYHTEKMVDGKSVKKSCVQLNFVVDVQDEDIRVNPEEHSVGIWAGDREVEGLEMTDGMREVVGGALEWMRWRRSHL